MGLGAARVGDVHACPASDGPKPHVGGPISPPGCIKVLIEGLAAARVGDKAVCTGPVDSITKGSLTVRIGGKFAARETDLCSHGGTITKGALKVLIG